ncbi:FAD binding domain-containing protein [Hypoxylon trugodes]|uniref:FAD binding domain-containing protein n=1 Tax=Hypoxylon trugodes TaxID=326681 RepID=UPI00219021C9|nr:FAD binding domain-containing protein [Hypoxylon trugodes]KAI1391801.1 FAD binding domain-containing protein [Hypoxylon trugodes]
MDSLVDLLIVGAGPAGLMLALWASKFNMRTRIIDEKNGRVSTGHADALHSRTLEIFHSFGIVQDFMSRAYHINEICSWNPDPSNGEEIRRTQRVVAQPSHLSRFPQSSLSQGTTEQILESGIRSEGKVEVERNTVPITLRLEEKEGYPILVTLRKIGENESARTTNTSSRKDDEIIRAKYLVGCDGSHSWVRDQVNMPMEGQRTDTHFGVMDIIPLTNFPDIRKSSVIHSKNGSVMTVPRENRLVRLYVQLGETAQGSRLVNPKDVTPEMILTYAQRIFKPYQLDFRVCDWHSVYTVGQRLAPRFDYKNRIFLAGDAVHTHSPTLGQGMNVSMQDTFNLGWKLGSVITGVASPKILSTYNDERHHVAKTLIDLDKEMTGFYSNGPSKESEDYQSFRDCFSRFLSGVAISYGPNALIADRSEQGLTEEVRLGQRLPSHKVVCNAEGNLVHLSDFFPSNGAWRILIFAGDVGSQSQFDIVQKIGASLEKFVNQFSSFNNPIIEVFLIHAGTRDFNILDLHPVYHPWNDKLGWDYWKVFSDDVGDFEPCRSPYEMYGVDKQRGCMVVLRPDQHVSFIGPLADFDNIQRFLSNVLIFRRE